MKYQKLFKDLSEQGEIRGNRKPSWPLVVMTLVFFSLVLGALIYGLYNASQIERAGMHACQAVKDPTCGVAR